MDSRRGAKEGVPIMAEAEHRLPPCENNGKSTENDGNNASCCSDSCCSDEGVVDAGPEKLLAVARPQGPVYVR